jgi:hypothetical protein
MNDVIDVLLVGDSAGERTEKSCLTIPVLFTTTHAFSGMVIHGYNSTAPGLLFMATVQFRLEYNRLTALFTLPYNPSFDG